VLAVGLTVPNKAENITILVIGLVGRDAINRVSTLVVSGKQGIELKKW
jgi:hypothetical protein